MTPAHWDIATVVGLVAPRIEFATCCPQCGAAYVSEEKRKAHAATHKPFQPAASTEVSPKAHG